jgi:phosphatidylglycerol:prolipoprotein diacylglycerol transferase
MLRDGAKRGLSEERIGTILLWALVGAIVGARFFYVLGHWSDFSDDPLSALRIWEGGISLIGGIAGAVAFAYPIMRRSGYRFLQVMDSAAIGLAFGIIIGRIGDMVIGDHLGKPTNFFLGWVYRGGDLPGPWTRTGPDEWSAVLPGGFVETLSRNGSRLLQDDGVVAIGRGVHQTALYDFLIAIGLFLFLRWLDRRPRREGVLIMSFAIVYGAGRVLTDFLRIDKTYFDTFTGSQLTSIGVILLSLITLWRFSRARPSSRRRGSRGPAAPRSRSATARR